MGNGWTGCCSTYSKPGSATLGEVLGALAEMLYGSYFGAAVLVSGLVQGVGSEVGFLAQDTNDY